MIRSEGFELQYSDGFVIRGDALLPEEATTGVVICHGFKGFARWGFFPYVAERIAGSGLNAITFDFSGSGVGADRESFTAQREFERNTYTREMRDLGAVEQEGRRRGWLGDRYGLLGHSRGGGVAILFAAGNERVAAVATWSAIANVGRWARDEIEIWRRRGYHEVTNTRTGQVLRLGTDILDEVEVKGKSLNILAAAEQIEAPMLIVHGEEDESVLPEDARRLARAAGPERGRLLLVPGVGHTYGVGHPMSSPSEALERVTGETVDFFSRHLE